MKPIFIDAVSVCSPGLASWEVAQAVFQHQLDFAPTPLERYKPTKLPANERRRATQLIRLTFKVCESIAAEQHINMSDFASVFTSSHGDSYIIDQISRALTLSEKLVSPTQFHNSVHNSAAGYWGIATGSTLPSCSLSAGEDSFITGLLEAICLSHALGKSTLLAAYDITPPSPLLQKLPIPQDFACAFALSPVETSHSMAKLTLDFFNDESMATQVDTSLENTELEHLRTHNPAARALPLLQALASKSSETKTLHFVQNHSIAMTVTPC